MDFEELQHSDITIYIRQNIITQISTMIKLSFKLNNFYCYHFVFSLPLNLSLNTKSVWKLLDFLKLTINSLQTWEVWLFIVQSGTVKKHLKYFQSFHCSVLRLLNFCSLYTNQIFPLFNLSLNDSISQGFYISES